MDEATSTTDVTGDDWEASLAWPPVISTKVAVAHVRDLLTFAIQSGNKSMIDGIVDVQEMVEEHSVRLAAEHC